MSKGANVHSDAVYNDGLIGGDLSDAKIKAIYARAGIDYTTGKRLPTAPQGAASVAGLAMLAEQRGIRVIYSKAMLAKMGEG
jgi:hypothetical protein